MKEVIRRLRYTRALSHIKEASEAYFKSDSDPLVTINYQQMVTALRIAAGLEDLPLAGPIQPPTEVRLHLALDDMELDPDNIVEGTTWGDTWHSSKAVAYGYNQALEEMRHRIKKMNL